MRFAALLTDVLGLYLDGGDRFDRSSRYIAFWGRALSGILFLGVTKIASASPLVSIPRWLCGET